MIDARLLLVGCGNMAGAMLARWLESGLGADQVTVVSPSGRSVPGGVRVIREIPPAGHDAFDIVILGLKPQQLAALRGGAVADHHPRLLLSILAGVEEEALAGLTRADAIVRVMPNLPVSLGKGVVALNSASADARGRTEVSGLMAPLGLVEWIDDATLFNAVTALMGCGPAFLFRFIDALAKGGAALGLEHDLAARLALATVEGAAAMAAHADVPPATLADRVASPGGSTRAGLDVLDADAALDRLVAATLRASADRNAVLATVART